MSADSPDLKSVSLTPSGPGKASDDEDTKIFQPVQYKLTCPLEYGGRDGHMVKAGFIMLYEPAGKNRDACFVIEQLFLRAFRENRKLELELEAMRDPDEVEAELKAARELLRERREAAAKGGETLSGISKSGTEDLPASMILQMIGSTSINVGEVSNGVRKLICGTGLAMIDDSVNLTPTLADEMPFREFKGLVGAYLAGFTVPSALEQT